MNASVGGRDRERWAVILAGGDGVRLRPLTRVVAGDERPKQFCALHGTETLLEGTRRRTALAIPRARTLVALTRAHERFYHPLISDMPRHSAVVQPANRGTGPAILYAMLRIAAVAPMAAVAILPSDHYVSDDRVLMRHVVDAFDAVRARPDLLVLLGVAADRAETDYGWIEPAETIRGTPLSRVKRFWEKPTRELAASLLERRCLWNSFVVIARVATLLSTIRSAVPQLDAAFGTVAAVIGTRAERRAVAALYARLAPASFSESVLETQPSNLAVLPVRGVQWSDWGKPGRVIATLAALGVHPAWADRVMVTA